MVLADDAPSRAGGLRDRPGSRFGVAVPGRAGSLGDSTGVGSASTPGSGRTGRTWVGLRPPDEISRRVDVAVQVQPAVLTAERALPARHLQSNRAAAGAAFATHLAVHAEFELVQRHRRLDLLKAPVEGEAGGAAVRGQRPPLRDGRIQCEAIRVMDRRDVAFTGMTSAHMTSMYGAGDTSLSPRMT